MNNKEILGQLGLSEKEAEIYLASLYMGPASVLSLSKAVNIHRPLLYKFIGGMTDKGLVKVTVEGKRKLYYVVEPKQLLDQLKKKEELLKEALPDLAALSYLGRKKPRITYYEGRERVQELLATQNQAKYKEIYSYFPAKYMIQLFGKKELEHVIQGRINKGIKLKLLRSTKADEEYEGSGLRRKAFREVRYLPDDKAFGMGIVIFDNKVNLFASMRENFGLQIESNDFSNIMRYLIENLWKNSIEMSTK